MINSIVNKRTDKYMDSTVVITSIDNNDIKRQSVHDIQREIDQSNNDVPNDDDKLLFDKSNDDSNDHNDLSNQVLNLMFYDPETDVHEMSVFRTKTERKKINFDLNDKDAHVQNYKQHLSNCLNAMFESYASYYKHVMYQEIQKHITYNELKFANVMLVNKHHFIDCLLHEKTSQHIDNTLSYITNPLTQSLEFNYLSPFSIYRKICASPIDFINKRIAHLFTYIRTTKKINMDEKFKYLQDNLLSGNTYVQLANIGRTAKSYKVSPDAFTCKFDPENPIKKSKKMFGLKYTNFNNKENLLSVHLTSDLSEIPQHITKLRIERVNMSEYYAVITYSYVDFVSVESDHICLEIKDILSDKLKTLSKQEPDTKYLRCIYDIFSDKIYVFNRTNDIRLDQLTIEKCEKQTFFNINDFDMFNLKKKLDGYKETLNIYRKRFKNKDVDGKLKSKAYVKICQQIVFLQQKIIYLINDFARQISLNFNVPIKIRVVDFDGHFDLISVELKKAIKQNGFSFDLPFHLYGINKSNDFLTSWITKFDDYLLDKIEKNETELTRHYKHKSNYDKKFGGKSYQLLFGKKDKTNKTSYYGNKLAEKNKDHAYDPSLLVKSYSPLSTPDIELVDVINNVSANGSNTNSVKVIAPLNSGNNIKLIRMSNGMDCLTEDISPEDAMVRAKVIMKMTDEKRVKFLPNRVQLK